ncbi:hypothetical protein PbJCM13498_04350 [Prolixibacter bellariivorans]|uniref:Uncharacterized protein n=2 Tax=Prolixibacter bellariivorans TaxID=314319 RepID=A0A5M4AUG4_9BACT|nr:hypothetical protein PbJCM13498_04350 [Prolixibacter bellariivorans]
MTLKMNIQELVEKEINDLWNLYGDKEFCKLPPLSVKEILDAGLMFIGINPSVSKNDRVKLIEEKEKRVGFYFLEHRDNHKYFAKFTEIAEKTDLPWSHLDLLYIRETEQNKIKSLLKTDDGIQFIYRQLMVSKSVIDKLISKTELVVFVVNNTLAREFLGKDRPNHYDDAQEHWMNYRFVWNDELGTYTCNGHPFFFTSMLTGQRALDNGSFERLIWHIRFVKSKLGI